MATILVSGVVIAACVIGYWFGRRSNYRWLAEFESERSQVLADAAAAADGKVATDIERALADLRLGVVVVTNDGTEAYRNNQGKQYATGRHGDALVEAALERVFDGALLGLSLEENVEVYGPPARSFLVQASPTYDGGEPDGAVGVIEDVTESRNTERVRSDFVANVSHELRTPVGAMSVLAETIAGTDDPLVVERLAARMQREAKRLSETIEDLLALSKLESGPLVDPETIDLVSVVTMAVERTAEAAAKQQVGVSVENVAETPILVDGDQGQLVSVVANLVDNAIKYSDRGTNVTVRLAAGVGQESDSAEITVVDVGIGIPERDLDRIFERFYRVDSARSRETGGTGLGLSIVRNTLRNHQGSIEVDSTEGQGSTFTLRLPMSDAQTQLSEES